MRNTINRKLVLLPLFFILSVSFIYAVDSTNSADYFFYDDMETASNFNKYYIKSYPQSGGGYNNTWAFDGSNSMSLNKSGGNDGTFYINTTEFSEYSEPYCIKFSYSFTHNPVANQESGIGFTAFAKAFVDYNSAGGTGNFSLVDGAAWNNVAIRVQSNNTWTNITLCMLSGYAGSGTTITTYYLNDIYKSNTSTLPRNSLNKLIFYNGRTGNLASFDNFKIWNYTKYGATAPPAPLTVISFINKTPTDITSTNIITQHPLWWYNYTTVNLTNPVMNYSVTDISRPCIITINGSCNLTNNTYVSVPPITNTTGSTGRTYYQFEIDENDIFPGTYPLNSNVFEATNHNTITLTGTGQYVSTELLNVSNASPYNFLEVYTSSVVNSDLTRIYACNSSYSTTVGTNVATNTNCINFGNINATTFDHTDMNSSHNIISFPISGGNISTVKITSTMYFMVRGASGNTNIGVIPVTTRQSTTKSTTNNGNAWTNETYTVDMHLHQYNAGTTGTVLSYAGCGTYSGVVSCTSIGTDNIDFTNLPPTAPQIISIVGGENFTKYINITYTPSLPTGTATIANYNISLLNRDGSVNITIVSNSASILNYTWNTFPNNLSIGQYAIRVTAIDSNGLIARDNSDPFNITKNGELNITANAYGTVVTNFTIILSGNDTQSTTTTNGTAPFYIVRGLNYTININSSAYSVSNTTLYASSIVTSYVFSLYFTNTFYLTFYNESSGLIMNESIQLSLISAGFASNYTALNGIFNVSLLLPGDYTIRYNRESTVIRDYYVTLVPQSVQNISLYLIDSDVSNIYTANIIDQSIKPLGNATIQLMRYYSSCNCYKVVEMTKTDTNGNGVLRVAPNIIPYKLMISKGIFSITTEPTKFTANSNIYTLNTIPNPLTSILAINTTMRSLTFNNNTRTYTYTWSDITNIVTQGCLNVQKFKAGVQTTEYSSCSSGTSGSIIYTITDTNNTRYIGTGSINTNTQFSTYYDSVEVQYTDGGVNIFGVTGLFIALILLILFVMMGAEAGTDAIILYSVLCLLGLGAFGIITASWSMLIPIIIIGAVVLYKMRT